MKKIFYFANIAPHYRKNLWQKLVETTNFEFYFFYGINKALKIHEIDILNEEFIPFKKRFHVLKNIWLKDKILLWQKGVITTCLKNNIHTAIFEGEFQIISTWIAMLICKLKGIQVVYWTHGLYGDEFYLKKKARVLFYKTADNLLVYENRAMKLLIKEGLDAKKLKVIYNSLDYDKQLIIRKKLIETEIYTKHFNNSNPTLIFIGRLTKVKKLEMLLEAQLLLKNIGVFVNTVFVGTGIEKDNLVKLAQKLDVKENSWFYGETYKEEEIAELLFNATLCVSPGNVGLTAIHSLSYGTPVCSHNNFYNQGPEVETITEWKTGILFVENSKDDLANKIKNWLNYSTERELIRENCYKIIDEFYNPYYQVNIINKILNELD